MKSVRFHIFRLIYWVLMSLAWGFGILTFGALVLVSTQATDLNNWWELFNESVVPGVKLYTTSFLSAYYVKWEFVYGPPRKIG